MVLTKSKSGLAATVAVCLAFVTSVAMAATVGWHGLSQSQRDSRILIEARTYSPGTRTNLSCKEWVRKVVRDASQNVVTIPSTRSNNYQWESSNDVYGYRATSCPPAGIDPGRIIQMVWRNRSNGRESPHTAIISSVTSTGMYWLDSNLDGDTRVQRHFVSFNDFDAAVGTRYTVYKIR